MTKLRPGWLDRAHAALREKILIGGIVGVICTIMYRSLQAYGWREPLLRADCPGWSLLPFHAGWVWPYLSMFALVGLAWLALPDAAAVRRFALHMLGLAAVGWICFGVWPTACIRPVGEDLPTAYRWLVALDQPTNCFPCLHSAFSVLAAWVLAPCGGRILRLLLWAWVAVLVVSIIALRQHTDSDTLTGVVLGFIAGWSFRRRQSGADERLGGRAVAGDEV